MIDLVLIAVGGATAGFGLVIATTRPRPIDILGAIAAPIGLALALLGATDLCARGFWG